MKRVGNLMQKLKTEENFIEAERLLGKNKSDNRQAQHISKNAERYGKLLFLKVQSGKFHWHKPREKTIMDSYNSKERKLKIPCLEDQAVQLAWLNVAKEHLLRKSYYYSCGSVPNAGQSRAVKGLKKMIKNPRVKYAATLDIKKFYDSCPHSAVRSALERVFKDKEFIDFAMGFVASMPETGVGLAIGYPVSHWLANLVLTHVDITITNKFPDVKLVRYMDDMTLVSANKRHLRKAVKELKRMVETVGLRLKKWSVYCFRGRGIPFLSYRFFTGYAILKKRVMYRIARRMRQAKKKLTAHAAMAVMSYLGICKHCDSYNFRRERVYPFVRKSDCSHTISLFNRKRATA